MHNTPTLDNEYHIYGPPGCGKTTKIAGEALRACRQHGEDKVLVISFTKAAKESFNFEGSGCAPRVSTLHSICWHMLGKPTIAETHIEEFNRAYPEYALSSEVFPGLDQRADDGQTSTGPGDRYYADREYNLAVCTPRERWADRVTAFDSLWTDFKRANGTMDFSDLISEVGSNFETFAGCPVEVFADEAQDFGRSELRLIRHLCGGGKTDRYVLAGDDDQTIYSFKGASPEDLLVELPEGHKTFLEQSRRVPRLVQEKAERWISRVKFRQTKIYHPREFDGHVTRSDATPNNPEPMLRSLERHLASGKSIMILVSCAYMLDAVLAVLTRHGIPFHNPYRLNRYNWNPLDLPGGRTSEADAVRALLQHSLQAHGQEARLWTPRELVRIAGVLSPGILKQGITWSELRSCPRYAGSAADAPSSGDEVLHRIAVDAPVDLSILQMVFTPDAVAGLIQEDAVEWFGDHLLPAHRRSRAMKLAMNACRKRGPGALTSTPQVTVGTIHSVKGGEADVVYLFPDLSTSGYKCWTGRRSEKDSVRRLMYVGMTRARETLVVCSPHKPKYSVEGL